MHAEFKRLEEKFVFLWDRMFFLFRKSKKRPRDWIHNPSGGQTKFFCPPFLLRKGSDVQGRVTLGTFVYQYTLFDAQVPAFISVCKAENVT